MLEYADTLSSDTNTRSDLAMTVGAREAADVQLDHLEKLGEELTRRGLQVRLELAPGRVPSLHVVNPNARALEEHVYAGCGSDGVWWFWWSWAERIAETNDMERAGAAIARVLASRPAI
jgi:hypothetical protein